MSRGVPGVGGWTGRKRRRVETRRGTQESVPHVPVIGSFRAQLTALYLAFFSLLFLLFSIFLYGELSRSLMARLDATLASEADTAAVLFPDELQEMKGDACGRRAAKW